MTDRNNLSEPFPPGFASQRLRLPPEEIERIRQRNKINFERQERYRKRLIEEGLLPPDPEPEEKKV